MGDIQTSSNNRPRKSTMSKIGRVFGLSSTNLVHEEQMLLQLASANVSTSTFSINGNEKSGRGSSASSINEPQPIKNSTKGSPLLKSRPQSPNGVPSPVLTGLQGLPPSRQSSLRKPKTDVKKLHPERAISPAGLDSSGQQQQQQHSTVSSVGLSRTPSSVSKSGLASSHSVQQSRFIMLEDGLHEHHLKNAKRQEKLGHMIKDLLGAKKLRNELVSAVPNILSSVIPPISEEPTIHETPQLQKPQANAPPSLLTGLVNQVKRGEITQYTPPTPLQQLAQQQQISLTSTIKVDSRSFVEKYGTCQEVIGRGAFGVVRISHKKDKTSEVFYAVKEFKRRPQESDKKYSRRLTSEFCISSSLQHPNIIHTLDLLQDLKGDYCEVMEFCTGGDLYSLIITLGKLEYVEADCFFKQLMRGVNYMHEMGVAHRDLKPENLLLTLNGTLKITDFGNSELFRTLWETDIHLSGGVCGSSPYIAPEEYTLEEFDPRKVDIWSCGVIYMAMRTGRQLWKLATPEDEFYSTYLEKRKDAEGYEPIESLKRARCRNVIYSILDPVPSRRITSKQILNSEWCREIKLCHAGEGKVN